MGLCFLTCTFRWVLFPFSSHGCWSPPIIRFFFSPPQMRRKDAVGLFPYGFYHRSTKLMHDIDHFVKWRMFDWMSVLLLTWFYYMYYEYGSLIWSSQCLVLLSSLSYIFLNQCSHSSMDTASLTQASTHIWGFERISRCNRHINAAALFLIISKTNLMRAIGHHQE